MLSLDGLNHRNQDKTDVRQRVRRRCDGIRGGDSWVGRQAQPPVRHRSGPHQVRAILQRHRRRRADRVRRHRLGVHLSHLRANRRDNPSARLLAALAELFGVPISYFFDTSTEDTINAELETLTALRNDQIKHLMQRAQGVSPRGLKHLEGILDQIRIMEGLDPDPND